MDDYPDSLKNLQRVVRKKAIEIANAMIKEGYSEGRAIPIATEQAKEWHKNANDNEINDFDKHGKVKKKSTNNQHARPELMDKAELVVPHDDGWAVQSKDAKKATKVFENKDDAIDYGKKIAENKNTELIIYRKDKTI